MAAASDHIPRTGRLVAVDWGTRRFGIAVSDPDQTIATPLATVSRRAGKRFPLRKFFDTIEGYDPVGLVVGLPHAAGEAEEDSGRAARLTGELLHDKTGLPVEYADERMSTARVLSTMRELGGNTRRQRESIDEMAAAVFLQQFLDRRRGT